MSTTVRPNVYETPEADAVIHPSGRIRLPSGVEVTAIPLVVRGEERLFAHLDYESALRVARREGAELIHSETVTELHEHAALELTPHVLPPDELMSSLARCRIHDGLVFADLAERWDGRGAVANAGKHWIAGAPPGRAYLRGWWQGGKFIQAGSLTGPGPHNDRHEDYATTTMLQWSPDAVHNEPWTPLAERCACWCENEIARGIKEEPPGSNTSARIREYLAPCVRDLDHDGEIDDPLGLIAAAWCCAAQCCAARECLAPGEEEPHAYVASGFELEADARERGIFREIGYTPKRGDLVIMLRTNSDPAKASWERHVVRVLTSGPEAGTTAGGNDGNSWAVRELRWNDPRIVGFVVYP